MSDIEQIMTDAFAEKARQLHNDGVLLRAELATARADAARWKENARFWYAQRDYLRDVIREFLAIAEDRRAGTWDDVMRISRAALESTDKVDDQRSAAREERGDGYS